MNFIERAAAIARCHSDDRPRRDNIDWNDGYQDGCKGASAAIYNDQVLINMQQEVYDLQTTVIRLQEENKQYKSGSM